MNNGKKFEQELKKSVPEGCFFYRLKDNAASFCKGTKTRFTSSNICDFQIFCDYYDYFIEAKRHKGSSLPFSCIRKSQLNGLANIEHPRIKAIYIINFIDKEKTYAVDAKLVKDFVDSSKRKSIPIDWCKKNGIEIHSKKIRTNYKYDLKKYFEEM